MFANTFRRATRAVRAPVSIAPAFGKNAQAGILRSQRRYASNGDISGYNSQICAVLGSQWGDEGKGKLVDILANKFDVVARFNGGANAGHTLVVDGKKFAFHLLPCGLLYPGKVNVIGNGVVLDCVTMFKELESLIEADITYLDRLKISDRAHLLFDIHKLVDGRQEAALKKANIGTTKKGIGPCYSSKATRNGVRVGELKNFETFKLKHRALIEDLCAQYGVEDYDIEEEQARFAEYAKQIVPMTVDTVHYINDAYTSGKTILAEGANAAMLDIDFGTYPYVTSSSTTAAGICSGLGIPPTRLDSSIGVVKAYTTRVGSGPFPTEDTGDVGTTLQEQGFEFGTTTGRRRRCGWLDIPVVMYSNAINNYQSINITKLDVLTGLKELKIGVAYKLNGEVLPGTLMPSLLKDLGDVEVVYESLEGWSEDITDMRSYDELPANAKKYIERIEELTGVPVSWIGVGPGRDAMIPKGFEA